MAPQLPDKLYFRIGEVAEIVGVEPHVLRYWETEFAAVRPEKSRRGQRVYSRRDVDTLLKVKELLYSHKYTIAGAKRKLRSEGLEPMDVEDPGLKEAMALRAAMEQLHGDLGDAMEAIRRLVDEPTSAREEDRPERRDAARATVDGREPAPRRGRVARTDHDKARGRNS